VVATIFLSYRRTDSPQACRVHDWLAQRFGLDALFMDVQAIPVAVSFPEYIRQAIESSLAGHRPDRHKMAREDPRGRRSGAPRDRSGDR